MTQPFQLVFFMSLNSCQRVSAVELKSSSSSEEAPVVSIQEALALAVPTLTLAAKGTMPMDTRVLVV